MRQLDLVEPVAMARSRGHVGAQRAAEKTERVVDPEWLEHACEAVRRFASNHDGLFTVEMMRGVIELQGELAKPCDARAWGAVTVVAVRRGLIEPTRTYHPAVSSNGAVRRCYRAGAQAKALMPDACRKCGGAMKPGKAMQNTLVTGLPDFAGSNDTRGQTMHHGGPGRLVNCSKCSACGWSVA